MDFQLSDDQKALAGVVRSLCEGRFPLDRLRQAEGRQRVVTSEDWAMLGEAGVFSIALATDRGGVGLGLADAAVVFEELGRALIPGPLVGSFLGAGLVAGAAEGATVVGVLEETEMMAGDARGPDQGAVIIEHMGSLDALLIVPTTGAVSPAPEGSHGPTLSRGNVAVLLDVAELQSAGRPVEHPFDPLTPVWRVPRADFSSLRAGATAVAPIDPAFPGRPDSLLDGPTSFSPSSLWQRGAVITAALQVGMAARCTEMATAYAKERRQFGRPIGGFQAVKHLCADMLVRAEVARSAVQAAAVIAEDPQARADVAEGAGVSPGAMTERTVFGAKLLADEAAVTNTRACIQVHGGMGFTWELPLHLFLKRARVLATTFGPVKDLELEVAARW